MYLTETSSGFIPPTRGRKWLMGLWLAALCLYGPGLLILTGVYVRATPIPALPKLLHVFSWVSFVLFCLVGIATAVFLLRRRGYRAVVIWATPMAISILLGWFVLQEVPVYTLETTYHDNGSVKTKVLEYREARDSYDVIDCDCVISERREWDEHGDLVFYGVGGYSDECLCRTGKAPRG